MGATPRSQPHSERPPWWMNALLVGVAGTTIWLLLGWANHWSVIIPVLFFVAGFLGLLA